MSAKKKQSEAAGRSQTGGNPAPPEAENFRIRDCSLMVLATGIRAQSLRELRDGLVQVHPGCIYHHIWGRLLQPRWDEPEYNNDFAAWAYHGLHDKVLAERLSLVDPVDYDDIEDVRLELVETVEDRLDESEVVPWSKADQQFHFLHSQLLVLKTGMEINDPRVLAQLVPELSLGSIFYHFIDARRRTDTRSDDFSAWLSGFGTEYEDLCLQLVHLDPYFSSLKQTRRRLSGIFNSYFGGGFGD